MSSKGIPFISYVIHVMIHSFQVCKGRKKRAVWAPPSLAARWFCKASFSSKHVFRGPQDSSRYADLCNSLGRSQAAPMRCTLPLDFMAVVSLWWVASPVFGILLPTRGSGMCSCRLWLERWRKRIDLLILTVCELRSERKIKTI